MHTNAWSWAHLLALRLAAGHRQHALATWLLDNVDKPGAHPPCPIAVSHWNIAHRQADALLRLGLKLIPVWRFLDVLRALKPLPPALFVWGNPELLNQRGIGIVGSRRASVEAMQWTQAFAKRAAKEGEVIISGGASGIDTAAHRGALQMGTPTIAYVGACIDSPYPPHNKPLFADIVATGGAIVSEYPPGEITYKGAHALRNRFIAAQASELTVVEAAANSGTLCTADWARRLGTPVRVSPEGIGRRREGLRLLLEQGHACAHPH
jgi:DNA processing protein